MEVVLELSIALGIVLSVGMLETAFSGLAM